MHTWWDRPTLESKKNWIRKSFRMKSEFVRMGMGEISKRRIGRKWRSYLEFWLKIKEKREKNESIGMSTSIVGPSPPLDLPKDRACPQQPTTLQKKWPQTWYVPIVRSLVRATHKFVELGYSLTLHSKSPKSCREGYKTICYIMFALWLSVGTTQKSKELTSEMLMKVFKS